MKKACMITGGGSGNKKEKTLWRSILLSCFIGMFLFMMEQMIALLDVGILNVILCLAGGVLPSLGAGMVNS